MKLYREVPPEKGTGLFLHEFKGDWAESTYRATLEPIEITEEEIVKILRGPRIGGDSILYLN
jgi:hypothetical protein